MRNLFLPLRRVNRRLAAQAPAIELRGMFRLDHQTLILRFEVVAPDAEGDSASEVRIAVDGGDAAGRLLELNVLHEQGNGVAVLRRAYSIVLAADVSSVEIALASPASRENAASLSLDASDLSRLLAEFDRASQDAEADPRYPEWERAHRPTRDELASQRRRQVEQGPLISVVIPVSGEDPEGFCRSVESVRRQTYGNWEIVAACTKETRGVVEALVGQTDGIRIAMMRAASGGSESMAACIAHAAGRAQGSYVAFLDQGDGIAVDCLFRVAEHLAGHPGIDMLYTDEDEVDDATGEHVRPRFKPRFNRDFLYSRDFVGSALVVSRALVGEAFSGTKPADAAWRYRLALAAAERDGGVCHVPRVLYHRHRGAAGLSGGASCREGRFAAERRALSEHLAQRGLKAVVEPSGVEGVHRTTFSPAGDPPLVSIVIPNKDHVDYLRPCLDSIYAQADYPAFEVVVVENNSVEPSTFDFYREAERSCENLRVVSCEGAFNYSKVVNFGASHARGELLLLLNNDTSVITPGFLGVMAGYFTRPEVGVVGPQLLFPDGLVQHAGLSLLRSGTLGFMNQNLSPGLHQGYMGSLACPFEYSAVLGACQMVRASTFREVGGYNEELAITCNDLDFCWKVRRLGLGVVYSPHVQLYHKEFGSRGSDAADPARKLRGIAEFELMRDSWPSYYLRGDGFVNPNCDDASAYYKLGA